MKHRHDIVHRFRMKKDSLPTKINEGSGLFLAFRFWFSGKDWGKGGEGKRSP